jgi:hypothetical protein
MKGKTIKAYFGCGIYAYKPGSKSVMSKSEQLPLNRFISTGDLFVFLHWIDPDHSV